MVLIRPTYHQIGKNYRISELYGENYEGLDFGVWPCPAHDPPK